MGVGALLAIALVAIIVLLFLVIKAEFSAYVSLLLVAMGTAIVAGIPIGEVVPVMIAGMGKVLGSVAIIVGLGSMLGRLVEVSGGAQALAETFTEKLGEKRVIAGVTIAAFILGIPLGMLAAYHRDKAPDAALRVLAILGYATPVFFAGMILKLIFGVFLPILPVVHKCCPSARLVEQPILVSLQAVRSARWRQKYWRVIGSKP